jgi:hypothetical protein
MKRSNRSFNSSILEDIPQATLNLINKAFFSFDKKFYTSSMGGYSTSRRGAGLDFAGFREYQNGDNIKHIDWNHYAKSSKLYIKEFEEEKDSYISLVLDTSHSMMHDDFSLAAVFSEDASDKPLSCKQLIATLGLISLKSFKKIMFSFHQDKINENGESLSANIVRTTNWQELETSIASLSASNVASLSEICSLHVNARSNASLLILISDFFYLKKDIQVALELLRRKVPHVIAIHILSNHDTFTHTESVVLKDSETGREYLSTKELQKTLLNKIEDHKRFLKNEFYSSGYNYFTYNIESGLDTFLNELVKYGLLKFQ